MEKAFHFLRSLFSRAARESTPREYALEAEAKALRGDLAASQLEASMLSSELKIAQLEVRCLAEVVERNRKRVEAETAQAARDVGLAENHNQR